MATVEPSPSNHIFRQSHDDPPPKIGRKLTLEDWNRNLAIDLVPVDIFLGLYIIFGIFGNALIVYVYRYRMKKKKIEDRFFILGLAVLDCIVCLSTSVHSLTWNILPVNYPMNWTCKIAWFTTRTISNTSAMLLLLIALQRYLKVCRPFGWQLTLPRQKMALAILFICSVIIDIPLLIFYGSSVVVNSKLNINGTRCGRLTDLSPNMMLGLDIYYIGMFITAILTMAGIGVIYYFIGRKIFLQTKKRQELGVGKGIRGISFKKKNNDQLKLEDVQPEAESYAESKAAGLEPTETVSYAESKDDLTDSKPETQTTNTRSSSSAPKTKTPTVKKKKKKTNPFVTYKYSIMFMTISAVTVATYLPSLIINMAVNIDSDWFWVEAHYQVRILCIFVFQAFLINHVCNPLIYGFFDTSFRAEIKDMFCNFSS